MRKLFLETRPFRSNVEPAYFLKPDSDIEGLTFFSNYISTLFFVDSGQGLTPLLVFKFKQHYFNMK